MRCLVTALLRKDEHQATTFWD